MLSNNFPSTSQHYTFPFNAQPLILVKDTNYVSDLQTASVVCKNKDDLTGLIANFPIGTVIRGCGRTK